MLEAIPASLFHRWMAFHEVCPFGPSAEWSRHAKQLQYFVAAHLKAGRTVPEFEDFLPDRMVGKGVLATAKEMAGRALASFKEVIWKPRDAETEKRKAEARQQALEFKQRLEAQRAKDEKSESVNRGRHG